MSDLIKEYYTRLGVSENATAEEVKKAYKKRALETHPDQGGNQEEFLKVQEAWEVLSGKKQAPKEHRRPNPGENYNWDQFDFGFNPFDFGRNQREEQRPPAHDSEIRITLQTNIEEVKVGKLYKVKYNKAFKCDPCEGVGAKSASQCETCKGRGIVQHVNQQQGAFYFIQTTPCVTCNARGKIFTDPCIVCDTKGYTLREENLAFKIERVKET